MRVPLLALAALVLITGVSRADDEDEYDDGFIPFKKWSIGISAMGHGTRIGGHAETGFGPFLELAHGRQRWQYVAEAGFASANIPSWPANPDEGAQGRMARGALGARWLARQFRPDRGGGIELLLTSMLGLQRFYIQDTTRLTRPELAFGFAVQGRLYKRPRIAFRLEARALFTPNDAEDALVACRGRCMEEAGSSTGFITGVGFAW